MLRSIRRTALLALAPLCAPLATTFAQQAVTVSGHVTSGGAPVAGVHVRIVSLRLDRTTDSQGRYSVVIPSANVRGQSVILTASMIERRPKYLPKSASLMLTGGPMVQDFDLAPAPDGDVAQSHDSTRPTPTGSVARGAVVDTLSLDEIAGAVSLPSALAGRFAGLDVRSSSVPGGSSFLTYRGTRSLLGSSQPLFVVDGLPVDNTVFTSSSQRYGAGGFDYGSPLQDLDLSNVASVQWLGRSSAGTMYGGRAANGVVRIETRNGAGDSPFAIYASQQITSESADRLPSYQNQYGQGLDGKFEFFNGRGGGINDSVAQSWGPALDGRPLAQASLTQAGRPDVRLWAAHANNVENYFADGKTLNTSVAVQGAGTLGSFRAFLGDRDTKGLSPGNSLVRQNAGGHIRIEPVARLALDATGTITQMKASDAAGTGFNETNPFSQFAVMGRQVDADALRTRLRDASGAQISWNYAGHNNPFVAPLENSNRSLRTHGFGGGSLTYAFSPGLTGTVRGGIDSDDDGRRFAIASGWMGGFPFFAAPGSFAKGGSENDDISAQQTTAGASLDAIRMISPSTRWTLHVGADLQSTHQEIHSAGIDSAVDVPSAGAPATATIPAAVSWSADLKTTAVFAQTGFAFGNVGSINASLRNEWSDLVTGHQTGTLYPAISASLDVLRALGSTPSSPKATSLTINGAWSRTGSDITPYALQSLFAGRAASGSLAPIGSALLLSDPSLTPEVTSSAQFGVDVSTLSRRLDFGVTVYDESTSGVILPVGNASLNTLVARNAADISNRGVEVQGVAHMGGGTGLWRWDIAANVAKNSSSVDNISTGTDRVLLSPTIWGVTLEARNGEPLGLIVGKKLLRDQGTGALVLRGGLPLPDSVAGPQKLGVAEPTWVAGLRNTITVGWVSLDVVADWHVGGSVFSGSKLWGDFAGNLSETTFRPDSGLLITGIDATTRTANTQHVSTQNYYHALAAVQEPWVYSATYMKLREARLSLSIPTTASHLPFESARISLIGRNLHTWSSVSGFDPELVLSPYYFSGIEMGQLPAAKSIGIQVSVTP
ncbi:MAG: TonB-dependent receptor plug domain-containing protein [bacterium]